MVFNNSGNVSSILAIGPISVFLRKSSGNHVNYNLTGDVKVYLMYASCICCFMFSVFHSMLTLDNPVTFLCNDS